MIFQRRRDAWRCCQAAAIWLLVGLTVARAAARVYGDNLDPVLARFPSRAELQQRIDEIRGNDPAAYEAARQDFDLAIRSRWTLEGPKWPVPRSEMPHHVEPGPLLTALRTRAMWEDSIKRARQLEGGERWAQFYYDHLDKLCFQDTPQLRAVLVDILLNGWDDWSEWQDEKPSAYRKKFPKLHRVYAIRELVRLSKVDREGGLMGGVKYSDINGVLLQIFANPETPPYLLTRAHYALGDLGRHFDSLEFAVNVGFSADDVETRERLQTAIPGFAQRASADPRVKAFWQAYLTSDIPVLRLEARKTHGFPVPDVIEQLHAQEEWVAENDPDPARRKEMARVIRRREILRKRQEGTLTPEEWEQWQRESRSP